MSESLDPKADMSRCPKCGAVASGHQPHWFRWSCGTNNLRLVDGGDPIPDDLDQTKACKFQVRINDLTAQLAAEKQLRRDAMAAHAKLEADWRAEKGRADNHWETLRSIRDIAREGDCERIINWVDDAASGYAETAEFTMAKLITLAAQAESDKDAAEARAAGLIDELQRYRKVRGENFGPFNPSKSSKMRECEAWSKVLALLAPAAEEGAGDVR